MPGLVYNFVCMEEFDLLREPQQRIDTRAVSYWRWKGVLALLFCGLIPLGYGIAARHWHWPGWITVVLAAAVVLFGIIDIMLVPGVRYSIWRYEVSDQEIDLLSGVLVKRHTLIPMVRVQHVDTEQGPIMRRYGLASVSISTAAGKHEIPALAEDKADVLRDRISELARVVDEDV